MIRSTQNAEFCLMIDRDTDRPPLRASTLLHDPARLGRALAIDLDRHRLDDGYRPWRTVRHIARDEGVDPVDAWAAIKWRRLAVRRMLELAQADGTPFHLCNVPELLVTLHRIDRTTGGGGAAALESESGLLADPAHRDRLRIRSLMDEAVESSLIEGAATTRRDAVELLRSAAVPRDKGERMVVNNYVAMQEIKRRLDQPLSPEMLLDLQAILTRDTLDRPEDVGRFRREGEPVHVADVRTNDVVFVPPPAAQLSERLKRLCDFANASHEGKKFLHPIVKASILHFLIGYEHPFPDGNGRTARAVFYWFAIRNDYRIFEFVPISERIRKGFARYPQAFIDTELDEGDLTYFVLYQLDIIELALEDLSNHLARETAKIKHAQRLLALAKDLNLRQRLLLEHGLRHPRTQYTVKSHMNSNGITPNTARADLDDLVRRRMMVTSKRGKEVIYHIAPTLPARLERKGL